MIEFEIDVRKINRLVEIFIFIGVFYGFILGLHIFFGFMSNVNFGDVIGFGVFTFIIGWCLRIYYDKNL